MSRRVQKILALVLRELLSPGALSAVAKGLLGGGVGETMRDRTLAALREAVRANLWRIVMVLVAGFLLVLAGGFLIAALFLWLLTCFDAPLAAAITGGGLLAAGALVLWLSGRRRADKMAPADAGAAPAGAASFRETAGGILRGLKEGLGRNALLIFVLLFIGGLWLGLQDESDDDEKTSPQ